MNLYALRHAISFFALTAPVAAQAQAQDQSRDQVDPPPQAVPINRPTELGPDGGIIVYAPALRGSDPLRSDVDIRLTQEDIATFGAQTIDQLLSRLLPGGGDPPMLMINGRRVSGTGDLSGLPPEAIERLDVLSGTASQAYGAGQARVVNIVLVPVFRAVTLSGEGRAATAGGRDEQRASVMVSRIQGNDRFALELGVARQSALFESERGLIASDAGLFDPLGYVTALLPGGEIDPGLSALAGGVVTIAGVPPGLGAPPSLAAFAATAGRPNPGSPGEFRTLLPATRRVDLAGTVATTLPGDISALFSARLAFAQSVAGRGPSRASLLLPAGSPWSPFADDVLVQRGFPGLRGLVSDGRTLNAQLNVTLNRSFGPWIAVLTGSYSRSGSSEIVGRGLDPAGLQARLDAADPGFNPFAPVDTAAVALLSPDESRSRGSSYVASFNLVGPAVRLPAGPLTVTLLIDTNARRVENDLVRAGVVRQIRSATAESSGRIGMTAPLLGRDMRLLGAIGDLSLLVSAGLRHEHGADWTSRTSYGVNWTPWPALSVTAISSTGDGRAPSEQRAAPIVETPNVPVFDFASGTTAFVTRIDGGNPALRAPGMRQTSVEAVFQISRAPQVSLRGIYVRDVQTDPIRALPAATPEIEAAFPDRFVRDRDGRLVSVDARPLNFARAVQRQLNAYLFAQLPLGLAGPAPSAEGAAPAPARPPARLNILLNHAWRISSRVQLRPGLPELDLDEEASLGARPPARHRVEGQLGISVAPLYLGAAANWQSGSSLGSGASRLRFSSLFTASLRMTHDLGRLLGGPTWLRGTSISLDLDNVFDARPRGRDALGNTPDAYRPVRLEPLGRALRLGLRRQF